MSKRQKFGLHGELWAKDQLEAMGHEARLITDFCDFYDLIVDDCLPVEVKISRQNHRYIRPGYYRPYFTFDVSRIPRNQDSVVILVCQDMQHQLWPYVVPSWFIGNRQCVVISHPKVYTGRYFDWRDKWEAVEWVKTIRTRLGQGLQLPLFV